MIRSILAVVGGVLWLILKFILIIGLSVTGLYCFGTMFFFRFIWEGLIRFLAFAGCALAVFLMIRASRKDDQPTEYDRKDY